MFINIEHIYLLNITKYDFLVCISHSAQNIIEIAPTSTALTVICKNIPLVMHEKELTLKAP
jgi:hypothetical protein